MQKGKAKFLSSGKVVGDPGNWNMIKDGRIIKTQNKEEAELETQNRFDMLDSEELKEYDVNDNGEVDTAKGKQRGEDGSSTLTTDTEVGEKQQDEGKLRQGSGSPDIQQKQTSGNMRRREEEKQSTKEWITQSFSDYKGAKESYSDREYISPN
ncbi:hypothetical protein HAX54_046553 [Datura stramonium]|uniref:Uncharacterized protein n=1 Tax=Datura stramonium TaxID=4076 RepID=A0ABS8WJ91_DATST|nr:hypothetical protein [Datura stramonium]